MQRLAWISVAVLLGCENPSLSVDDPCARESRCELTTGTLTGRLKAVGLQGAGAVREVGRFLEKSPIGLNAPFAAFTAPGKVLAPERVLVTSQSNFGAALARADHLPGSVLSLDVSGQLPLVIPPDFARGGGQAQALQGRAQVYTAQSPQFLNSVYHADAVTAGYASVGEPLGISINNGFGRPWFANAVLSSGAEGSVTVTDPDGRPLAAVVSRPAGGVFAGELTGRAGQLIPGALKPDCIGTAFLGPSPDGSQRAVFAALNADGALTQVHVEKGVDGLTPPGTVRSIAEERALARSAGSPAAKVTRAGIVFNWVPIKSLFVTDPLENAVVEVRLSQDVAVFRAAQVLRYPSEYFNVPVDLAPAVAETVSFDFSSGTTLAGGSDLYVANRGNGTLVRMTQSGRVIAVRDLELSGLGRVGAGRVNGIATSSDAKKLYVTLTGTHPDHPESDGLLIEVDAFGGHAAP